MRWRGCFEGCCVFMLVGMPLCRARVFVFGLVVVGSCLSIPYVYAALYCRAPKDKEQCIRRLYDRYCSEWGKLLVSDGQV